MKFFFDASVSTKLVKALCEVAAGARYEIVALEDKFPSSTPDTDWLRELGREGGWTIVTADPRISRNPTEQAAWAEAGLTTLFLGDEFSAAGRWVQAARLFAAWPAILIVARESRIGSAFFVNKNGSLRPREIPSKRKK